MKHSHPSIFTHTTRRGFSLVEMIVAMGIFAVVAVVALGALVKIISANKKAQSLQASVTNLNYALDSMTREMRVGKTYDCDRTFSGDTVSAASCSSFSGSSDGDDRATGQSAVIAFASSKSAQSTSGTCSLIIAYRFNPNPDPQGHGYILEKAEQDSCDVGISDESFAPIVDKNVTITGYYLNVTDDTYPLATIRISGYAGVREKEKTFFDVQTAVSPRIL